MFYALSPKDAHQSNIPATNKQLVLGFMSIIEEHNIPIDSESEELIDTHYQSFLSKIEDDSQQSGYDADSENEDFDPEEGEFLYISFVPASHKIQDDPYSKRRESDSADSGIEDISYLSEGTASPAGDPSFTSQINTSPQVEASGMIGLFDGLYDGILLTAC